MANFDIADDLVRNIERGYAFHPSDRGLETYCGMSRRVWPNEPVWQYIDKAKELPGFPKNIDHVMLKPMVTLFYRREFWDVIKGDLIVNQLIANQVYDIAVNAGSKTAGRYLQRTLNLLNRQGIDYADIDDDGVIGKDTLHALEQYLNIRQELGVYLLGFYLLIQMGALWIRLASKDKSQEDFMNGWGKRGLLAALQYAKHYFRKVK